MTEAGSFCENTQADIFCDSLQATPVKKSRLSLKKRHVDKVCSSVEITPMCGEQSVAAVDGLMMNPAVKSVKRMIFPSHNPDAKNAATSASRFKGIFSLN